MGAGITLFLAGLICESQANSDGLFAVFDTTMGAFTCELAYQDAPQTVANFIGLAQEDAHPWIDLNTGEVRHEPYYDGIIFHRVIDGFMIQAGSPAGNGLDGPGYSFRDEFSTNLSHSATGTLSMANSGLHSNGSQFFVTLVPTPHLDGVHSVFGKVVSGLDTVLSIGQVATGAKDKPLTNVVIRSVTIVTNGSEAAAFDIGAQSLPEVLEPETALARVGTEWVLQTAPQLNHEHVVYGSEDLTTWTAGDPTLSVEEPSHSTLDVTARVEEEGMRFFSVTDVAYSGPLHTPTDLVDTQVTFAVDNYGLMAILLNETGGGLWISNFLPVGSGAITDSTWVQSAYNGSLTLFLDQGIVPMRFSMDFQSPVGGAIKGTFYTVPSIPVTGSFTIP